MVPLEERPRYESDLGMTWSLLPIVMVGAFAAAVGVAWLLKTAYILGWYLYILFPAVGGAILGGVLYALLGWSRCRNQWLAGSLGIVAGLIAYLGYFQLAMTHRLPLRFVGRVDWLPRYIVARMQNDVIGDIGKPNVGGQPKKPFVPLNWFFFGVELLFVPGAAAALAWTRARLAYSPELGKWLRRETALLSPQSGPGFPQAIETGTLPEFIAATPPVGDAQKACRLSLEYAEPDDGSVLEYPIYATLDDSPVSGRWFRARQLRRGRLRQVELEPAEVLALRPLFPYLSRLLEAKHEALRDMPAEVLVAAVEEVPATEVAEITPVPEPFRQRVRGKGYAVALNLRGLIPLAYFLGGAGGVAGGIWLVARGSVPQGCTTIGVGAAALVWGAYTALFCLGVYENRWVNRRLRAEVSQRSDAVVAASDPEAGYVSIIPRDSFIKIKWTMASDVLLFRLDEQRRQVLMEGDSDRYRIPAGAISVCEPQCFFHPIDPGHRNELWMVRLVVRVEEGSRELLISPNHTDWAPLTNARRWHRAEEICRRINQLRG
jgi:hypothetical protein